MNFFPNHTRIIIVSDCHLTNPNDQRTRSFLNLCQQAESSDAEYFLLLGDIFDFILGSKKYYQQKYEIIGKALEKVAKTGTKVIYLEGNHEADIVHLPWKGITFVSEGTHFIKLKDGIKLQMAHGDLIYSDLAYRRFRAVVKSKAFRGAVRLLPGKQIDKLFLKSSEISRSQDNYRSFNHKALFDALDQWLNEGQSDYGLFGHFHLPYAEKAVKSAGELFSVESWDNPNVLTLEQDGFFRYFIQNEKITKKEKAVSILSSCKSKLQIKT